MRRFKYGKFTTFIYFILIILKTHVLQLIHQIGVKIILNYIRRIKFLWILIELLLFLTIIILLWNCIFQQLWIYWNIYLFFIILNRILLKRYITFIFLLIYLNFDVLFRIFLTWILFFKSSYVFFNLRFTLFYLLLLNFLFIILRIYYIQIFLIFFLLLTFLW